MFRHVVLFTWTEDATEAQKHALAGELRKLPSVIDAIRLYHVGPDAGLNPGNFDFAVVADFDDADGYTAYRDHPVHREIVEKYVNPIVTRRAAVQYEL
ncbi:MAG TPA: Dabb family protein [Streptosporangiaceae bacterium]|nr:Dabb family protein [Streptosporangiaceae bacterium]